MTGIFRSILEWIESWVGSYGWSVVVFTLLIRVVLLPLDIKSKKSMRAMSKIQPKVQALQKKYANDKEKLNTKMQELYRKEHVSPMAGCLPMLISLPILWWMFAAMRYMANNYTIAMIINMSDMAAAGKTAEEIAAAVKGNMQGWLWIKNVFQPDSFTSTILPKVNDALTTITKANGYTYLTEEYIAAAKEFLTTDIYAEIAAQFGTAQFTTVKLSLLIANPTINIPKSFTALWQYANGLFLLPLMAAGSQLLMTSVTGNQPKKKKDADGNAVEEEAPAANAMNSGFMKWFFPLFSLWICAGYNAAFAIYWMAANVIQIVQQIAVNKYFDHKDAKQALIEGDAESK